MAKPTNRQECIEQLAEALQAIAGVAEYLRTDPDAIYLWWDQLMQARYRVDSVHHHLIAQRTLAEMIKAERAASNIDRSNITDSPN